MAAKTGHDDAVLQISGTYKGELLINRAVVREKLSTLTEMLVEFVTGDENFEISNILGFKMSVTIETTDGKKRRFSGLVVAAEELELLTGKRHFVAEVRPELWITTKARNNRIFQEMSALDIIREVLNEHGLSDHKIPTGADYQPREYCVQYRETDFDFINRLMEEEGIYYYFDYEGDNHKDTLVMCGSTSGVKPIDGKSPLDFFQRDESNSRRGDHVQEWQYTQRITSGRVELQDFDFLAPATDFLTSKKIEQGTHSYKSKVMYDYPGHYRKETGLGETRARIRMEAEAARFDRRTGMATVRTMATGRKFKLDGLEGSRKVDNDKDFLQTDAVYYMQLVTGFDQEKVAELSPLQFPEAAKGIFTVMFGAIPAATPYRAPLDTPWPAISGLHTAIVTGPSGDEIHTDEHGRIKVQFPWDRAGKKDENTTCWVRVVTPWSGKNWGAVSIPRIGQEVVIQFEEGDPDRPICTGMLYNAATKPPYELPANKTQTGIKTNSSKGGGGFNELLFEDKKGEEFVRLQSEKDYVEIIKNNATITVGMEKADPGDMSLSVNNDRSETVGNDETISIGNNRTETVGADESISIGGSQTQNIGADRTLEVASSETHDIGTTHSQTVGTSQEVAVGTSQEVSIGTSQDVSIGTSGSIEAGMSYEIKVGGSSIKIDPSGVTIKGPMITIKADGMIQMKSPMTNIKGDGLLILKGGVTLIN